MRDNTEIEIKLRVLPGRVDGFGDRQAQAPGSFQRRQMHTAYFDDGRHSLHRRGLELRVRETPDGHVQTLKAGAGFERGEWEAPLPNQQPSLTALPDDAAVDDLPSENTLQEVFAYEVERREWRVVHEDSEIAISVDDGTLEAGDASLPVTEAELELKSGTSRSLFSLARQIVEQEDAPPSFVGKGLRGYRLASGRSRAAEHGVSLHLSPQMSVATAFQAIVGACLRPVSINEEILRATSDPEAIHQMRVALRRLRAAHSLFRPIVGGAAADGIRRDMSWISDLLGRARDLDVFVAGPLAATVRRHPDVPGMSALHARLEQSRQEAYGAVRDALASPRYRQLLLSVLEHAHVGEWLSDGVSAHASTWPFVQFARSELDRRYRAIARKRKAVRGEDASKRHRVRIRAKKLRYMADFMRSIAPPKRFTRTSDALKGLQAFLGSMQDVIAGERLLAHAVEECGEDGVTFAATLVAHQQRTASNDIKDARRAHNRLRQQAPFWAKL